MCLMCVILSFVFGCLFFFFFKQKTAYEMRISDWSSDVCSSDLSSGALDCFVGLRPPRNDDSKLRARRHWSFRPRAARMRCARRGANGHRRNSVCREREENRRGTENRSERKSVVEGKSDSVRVDGGGRRSNKTQKKQQSQTAQQTHHNITNQNA